MSDFNLVDLKPEPFVFVSRACATSEIPRIMSEAFCDLHAALARTPATPAGPPLAHFRSVREGHVEVDVGFPMSPAGLEVARKAGLQVGETACGKALYGKHVGPYESLAETYEAMIAELRDLGFTPADDMWERYLTGEGTPPERTQTEVLWPALPLH